MRVLGEFILDESARTLTRQDDVIPLTPKEFDTLVFLVEAHGKAVEKNELVRAVWKDIFVGDNSLARNISVLRRYLGAGAIQTLPKFGYRFALPVTQPSSELLAGGTAPLPEPVELDESPAKAPMTLIPNPAGLRMQLGSRVLIAAVVPLVLLSGAAILAPRLPKRTINHPPKIAVLPLRNHSTNPEETNYLRDGIADEVTDRLCQLSFDRLRVLARASSGQYTDTSKAPRQIAEELGAQYLVDGTIEVDRSQVRLNVQLIDGPDQTILWSKRFEGPVPELPVFEDNVVEAVASSVHVPPQPGKPNGALPGESASAEAHDAYLRGRYLLEQKTSQSEREALKQFQRAVSLDPHYARAFEAISETYIFMGGSMLPDRPFLKAKEAALQAIRIDGNLAEAHRDLAYAVFGDEANISGADAEYRRSIALNPDDARAHHWYAQLLAAERLYPASLGEATTGYQLDPRSVGSIYNYGFMLIEAGQPSNGVHVLQDLLKREPQNDVAWGYLGAGYSAMRQYGRSADAFLQASKFSAVKVEYRASYAYALAMDGQKDKASAVVLELEHKYSSGTWVPGQAMTTAYIALGDKDKQLLWLKRGLIDRSIGPFEANAEPIYSATLSDPRLMKEIGRMIEAH